MSELAVAWRWHRLGVWHLTNNPDQAAAVRRAGEVSVEPLYANPSAALAILELRDALAATGEALIGLSVLLGHPEACGQREAFTAVADRMTEIASDLVAKLPREGAG
jgi:hypothetical protein